MAGQGGWAVEWYKTRSGELPLRTFLNGLTPEHGQDAFMLLEAPERYGNLLRPPKSKLVESGLFELRGSTRSACSTSSGRGGGLSCSTAS